MICWISNIRLEKLEIDKKQKKSTNRFFSTFYGPQWIDGAKVTPLPLPISISIGIIWELPLLLRGFSPLEVVKKSKGGNEPWMWSTIHCVTISLVNFYCLYYQDKFWCSSRTSAAKIYGLKKQLLGENRLFIVAPQNWIFCSKLTLGKSKIHFSENLYF